MSVTYFRWRCPRCHGITEQCYRCSECENPLTDHNLTLVTARAQIASAPEDGPGGAA